ncbi:MAG: hypothetical protein CM1200mP12_10160 [Gammaproteobacteria bacterium]|nr:MAG: hypothetical protein CM1200mP12_10160 [Gammaproteobacteria bacterium]
MNSSDIKPVRSEALDNRKRRNIGGVAYFLFLYWGPINLGGLVYLVYGSLMLLAISKKRAQNFVGRISFLEEENLFNEDSKRRNLWSLEEKTKFIDKEIRKLWDFK